MAEPATGLCAATGASSNPVARAAASAAVLAEEEAIDADDTPPGTH